MKILHFGSNYLPNKGGNVVRMTNMLENNKSGNELFIMTTAQQQDFDDDKYYQEKGIRIFRIKTLDDAKQQLPRVVKEYGIDIVVTHIIPANMIACKSLPKDVIIMTEVHSLIDSGSLKNALKGMLHRFVLNRRTQKYFTLSQGASEYIKANYGVKEKNIVFLPNGSKIDAGVRKNGNPDYFTFGYCGTFYDWQGTDVLIKNVDKILSLGENVRVYLIGGGYKEDVLKEMAEKSNGRLVVTGLVPKDEANCLMDEIDVLMIPRPSMLETETAIPLKIFDSVESGKPVIISDVYGLVEVLSENEAFVYSKKDENGLYNACKTAYENPELLDSKYTASVEKLKQWYTWDDIHKKQNDVFKEVLNAHKN